MEQRPLTSEKLARLQVARELGRLRKACRMPQRQLAALLFVERSYISHAESGRMLPARRFWELADRELQAEGSLIALFDHVTRPDHVAERTIEGFYETESANQSAAATGAALGPSSSRRTKSLLAQIDEQNKTSRLVYIESPELAESMHAFLAQSARRVFILKGPAGSGKSRFISELGRRLIDEIYLQLH